MESRALGLIDALAALWWASVRTLPVSTTRRRIVAILHGVAKLALVGFCVGLVGLILVLLLLDPFSRIANVLGNNCLCLVVAAGLLHAITMFARDAAASPSTQPRFSLRTLLIAMTVAAVTLGLLMYMVRR